MLPVMAHVEILSYAMLQEENNILMVRHSFLVQREKVWVRVREISFNFQSGDHHLLVCKGAQNSLVKSYVKVVLPYIP